MQLFVYGGLLKGMALASFIEGSEYLGPAFIRAEIYFLGQFPGIIPGSDIVFGELYEIGDHILPGVDKVEEYYPDDIKGSTYIRKELDVVCLPNRKKVKAEAYFYNKPVEGEIRISNGDYRRFVSEHKKETCWVINSVLGGKTNGFFKDLKRTPLVKNGLIETINGLKPNGIHDKEQLKVNLIKLKKDEILELDRKSNVPAKYARASVPFINDNGETQLAHTYYPNPLSGN